MNSVLHIMIADKKFNLPLVNWMIKQEELKNHKFLIITTNEFLLNETSRIIKIESPVKNKILSNLKAFFTEVNKNDSIVLHGLPLIYLLFFCPHKWKKTSWVINGADLYGFVKSKKISFWKKLMFSRFKSHITHIEGDSMLANKIFNSKAKFIYSPMYLSNTVRTNFFTEDKKINNDFVILVGNSLSPNNNHIHIFEQLSKNASKIEKIICPINYGLDMEYKNKVIEFGFFYFKDKFHPITEFLPLTDYEAILSKVDIAVFDHWRQEAMGVTLMLLSLGKTVFMNSKTTSYESLESRGFKVFDNKKIFENGPSMENVSENKALLEQYYSIDRLVKSLKSIAD
jgi:dTDP-N-acetylfucosamine:lipid II N-acetylfucosaminyltransferase